MCSVLVSRRIPGDGRGQESGGGADYSVLSLFRIVRLGSRQFAWRVIGRVRRIQLLNNLGEEASKKTERTRTSGKKYRHVLFFVNCHSSLFVENILT